MYWSPGIKRDVANFVTNCLVCHKVKTEHHRLLNLLQPIEIPKWRWEIISMDFAMGLSSTHMGLDVIWVIVNRLTKSTHFLPIKVTSSINRLEDLYIKDVVGLH